MQPPTALTVAGAVEQIWCGALSPVELVKACLARIEALDDRIQAWAHVDRLGALAAAEERAREAERKAFLGPLHGVPIGIKDIFHVAGLPTTAGARGFATVIPEVDAAVITKLRAAGAIILGETVSTEFAFTDPAVTRNPWNLEHTPGGSSSGSAAAVAARMVPAALGSQTVGSTLRPAAYCGAVGFKSTYGRISRRGVLALAWSLDHVGLFARSVQDVGLLFDVLAGYDPHDPGSAPVVAPPSVPQRDRPPRLGLIRGEFVERATPEVQAHLEGVAQRFAEEGATIEEIELPGWMALVVSTINVILRVEAAAYHAERYRQHGNQFRPKIRTAIEAGMLVPAEAYLQAHRIRRRFRRELSAVLSRVDALLMPVAPSPAPRDLTTTGDGAFCAPASLTGLPALSLPSGLSHDGLPLAIQFIGRAFEEPQLLSIAHWCESALAVSLRTED